MSSTVRVLDHPPHGRLPAADRPAKTGTAAAPPRPRVRASAGWRRVAAALAGPAAMLLASFGFRAMALLQAVIDTDEGLYLVQAQAWLRGDWPLIAVWDMHPVGAPAMIALSLLAFGESVGAVRLLGILCVAATGWALFGLVRAAGGGRGLGIGAGLLYIAETVQLRGLATNTEILFAPFVAAAMAVAAGAAARALRDTAPAAPRWRELLAMGALVGAAVAIKQVVALEGCLAFALLTFPALRRGALPVRRFLGMAAAYAVLCALPTALFALAYWWRGGLEVFLDSLFVAPFRYSMGRLGPWEALQPISTALATLLWPVLLAGIGVASWCRRPAAAAARAEGGGAAPEALLARVGLLWFVVGTLAIAGPGYFYPHYFLIWLPSLSVLGALGAATLARMARPRLMPVAFAGILGVTAADAWRSDAAPRLDRGIGIWQPDPVQEVAEAVELRSRPGEPVFIVNYHPVVYFLAKAGLPTRFVFPAHLSGDFDEVSDIDTDAELSRVLASRPRLVVVDRGWWQQLRPRAATTVTAALQADYVLADTVAEERGPVEIWQFR
jgi:hypothetical protein